MMSKNHEILNIASRHQGEGLHQISAQNSKVENTGHVRYFELLRKNRIQDQNSIKSAPIDPEFCGRAPRVAKMLLHENHSLSCLTTSEIKGKRKSRSS